MKLRFVYRSWEGGTHKNRPPFFDKAMALASYLRAARTVQAELVFLNDGPIPGCLLAAMDRAGRVESRTALGNSGSYRDAVRLALADPKPDLVYLAEDDYLYLPHAFSTLLAAAVGLPAADYFTLYDHRDRYTRTDEADGGRSRLWVAPPLPASPPTPAVPEHHWRTVESTCMSFAARSEALIEDRKLHEGGTRDSIPADRALWRRIQGYGPLRRSRHTLISPVPSLATHLESEYLAPAVDWNRAATEARAWADREKLFAKS